jgi:hypothetical protein
MCGCGLDYSVSGHDRVASSCEQATDISGSTECKKLLDQWSESYLQLLDACVCNVKIRESEMVLTMTPFPHAIFTYSILFQCVNFVVNYASHCSCYWQKW